MEFKIHSITINQTKCLVNTRKQRQNVLKQDKMSLFKNIFGDSNQQSQDPKINWVALDTISQLDTISSSSSEKPVVIFKHSTRCSISRMVLKQLENEYDYKDDEVTPYFLDLLSYRDISNEIAIRFGVQHQSPQIIVIKDGKSVYNASHDGIHAEDVKAFLG